MTVSMSLIGKCFRSKVLRSLCRRNFFSGKKKPEDVSLIERPVFFDALPEKSKNAFISALQTFQDTNPHRRGHVEFIYAAMNCMQEFGVHKDLETYKKLMDIFPKGKMIPESIWQVEFMHFPRHQQCALDLLQQIEDNGVMPDVELRDLIVNSFGTKTHPYRKLARMMYWIPKFKNASPFPLPNPLPDLTLELAKLAIRRMSSVDLQTKIDIYETKDIEDAVDHTWIVSAQSPDQQNLIEKHPENSPIYVDGAFRVWLRDKCIVYFTLRTEPKPLQPRQTKEQMDDVSALPVYVFSESAEEREMILRPSVHEQEDGNIYAMCATGTSSRDSLLSWVRFLQKTNSRLGNIPILFTLKAPSLDVVSINAAQKPSVEGIGDATNDENTNLKNESAKN